MTVPDAVRPASGAPVSTAAAAAPELAATLLRLADLDAMPVHGHVALYDSLHQALAEALGSTLGQ